MPSKRRKAAPPPDRINEEPARALDFNEGDERGGRTGDPRSPARVREEFPADRARLAGLTGGSNPDHEVTADDLSPETLLDEDRSHSPAVERRRGAADSRLRDVGADDIGAGHGLDEAELAHDEAEEEFDEDEH